METDGYSLVLSGGGAKGVYHIGAWRALKEMEIPVTAFYGNSIGAIMATLLAQGLEEELEDLSERISLDYIIDIPPDLIHDGELTVNLRKTGAFREFYKNASSKGGLDTSPLRRLLERFVDEDAVRASGRDLGMVTYNITDMKPREVFLDEMNEGELVDYAMASAAVPGFQRPEIGGKKFIDGGIFDNIPYAMARRRGRRNIIVIDISGVGMNRKPDIQGTRTVYIKNSIDMGGILDFDRRFLSDYKLLGYLDTMRTFGRFAGMAYFIVPDETVERAFAAYLETEAGSLKLKPRTKNGRPDDGPEEPTAQTVRRLLPKQCRYDPRWLPLFADCAAEILSLPRVREYSYAELFDALEIREREIREEVGALGESDRKKTEGRIRREMRKKELLRTPYLYFQLAERYLPGRLSRSLERYVLNRHPSLATGIRFLEMLEEFRSSLG